jgi:hypothetical protein
VDIILVLGSAFGSGFVAFVYRRWNARSFILQKTDNDAPLSKFQSRDHTVARGNGETANVPTEKKRKINVPVPCLPPFFAPCAYRPRI